MDSIFNLSEHVHPSVLGKIIQSLTSNKNPPKEEKLICEKAQTQKCIIGCSPVFIHWYCGMPQHFSNYSAVLYNEYELTPY